MKLQIKELLNSYRLVSTVPFKKELHSFFLFSKASTEVYLLKETRQTESRKIKNQTWNINENAFLYRGSGYVMKMSTLIPKTFVATNFRTKKCPKVYNAEPFRVLYKSHILLWKSCHLLKIRVFSEICPKVFSPKFALFYKFLSSAKDYQGAYNFRLQLPAEGCETVKSFTEAIRWVLG